MRRGDAGWTPHDHGSQGDAADPRPGEALDGGPHPPLQALYRGLPRAGRRDLLRHRGAEGRVRGLSRLRRNEPAVSLQDPFPELRPSPIHGLSQPRSHAGGFGGDPGLHGHRLRRDRPMSESFAFTPENKARAEKIIAKYPSGRQASAVLALLDMAQRQSGGLLPRAAMDQVAETLEMAPIRVYEVATFYSMFNLKPVGQHLIQICRTTPCWLRGSDTLAETCKAKLGVGLKETTADGKFTVVEVECLGACANAPMVQINDDYYEDLDAAKMEALLTALGRGETPKIGSQIGRQGSAPEGGPTTLLEFADKK